MEYQSNQSIYFGVREFSDANNYNCGNLDFMTEYHACIMAWIAQSRYFSAWYVLETKGITACPLKSNSGC